tara:strand:+ start:1029 stop:2342 length:1314 start_codon:yes stop_codon:yes gene_type:complete
MNYLSLNSLKLKGIEKYGFLFFLIGVFFLPSTLFIAILFLLPAALISSFTHKNFYLKDKWNYPFLVFGILILSSSFLQNFVLRNNYYEIWDPMLSFINLGNWIPYIWLFWAFQPYLNSISKRRFFALVLIAGTFPVLITGFGQYYFNWFGPFKTLGGLIIWYQRPIENPAGLSGLFSSQNYAGSWLNIVWPFCIALFLEKKNNFFRKTIALSFAISIGFAGFLTYSRNAWLGLLISLPIMIDRKRLKLFLPIMVFLIIIILFIFSPLFTNEISNSIRNLFPEKILLEFSSEGYEGLDSTRLDIYSKAISLIRESPIFGIGAASFPKIYQLETSFWKGHSHNLLLELAVSYGLPACLIFFTTINILIFHSGRMIFIESKYNDISLFDKAFWTALLFFIISQLADIQYFDGKISLIIWILIAGVKKILEERNNRISESP